MIKQVFLVNKELKMGKGKICAQVAHASISCYEKMLLLSKTDKKIKDILENWKKEGQKKIVLKASLKEILELKNKLENKIPLCLIRDKGLTQVPEGAITVLGIGPWYEEEIDKYTKDFKLL
ncbi:MAG TPA: aminoacyl-tRNA hydrolase [Nautiliaceae bacterium]|nr:aminoacyl-tRNA hydrolase [Nautiliaceae bacterium]